MRLIDSAVQWFRPPILPSAEATRRARALWTVSWVFLGLVIVLLIVASIISPDTAPRRAVSIGMTSALILFLHGLNRRGRTALASRILVLGLTAIITQRAWYTGGVQSPVAVFYMMFMLMAAGLLGVQGSAISAVASLVSATALVIGQLAGRIVPLDATSSPAQGYIIVVLALAVTLLCLTLLLRQAEQVARDDLVDMFVHDMRSPLMVAMAHLAMLREDLHGDSETSQQIDAALSATVSVHRMANNLLDISRLENAQLPLQRRPTDLTQVAQELADAMGALDPASSVEVRAPTPVVCDCDPELIRRIIENLLSNAFKHAPAGGHIVVEVSAASGHFRIAVQDDGPGIPQHARGRIFERYSAAGMHTLSGTHSVGLGLAFCRLAATAHDGRIWVEDVTPHGSRFVLEVPTG